MSKNIQTFDSAQQTISAYLYKKKLPDMYGEREMVVYCTYSNLNDYYIGCGWRFAGQTNSCTVYYVLSDEMCNDFTEQMYNDIQLELERKVKKALIENRKKELEKDF